MAGDRLLFITLGVAGFIAGAELLRWAIPPYLEPGRQRDLYEHYRKSNGRYDTLIFGTSRVQFGVVPAVFDASNAAAGVTTRSVNLGMAGLNNVGVEEFARKVLAEHPGTVEHVFIDPGDLRVGVEPASRYTEHSLSWHNVSGTWHVLQLMPWQHGDWDDTKGHIEIFAEHWSNLGRAKAYLELMTDRERRSAATEVGLAESAGYECLDNRLVTGHLRHDWAVEHRRAFQKTRKRWRATAKRLRARLPKRTDPAAVELVRRLVSLVRAHGARPIIFAMPRLDGKSSYLLGAKKAGVVDDLLYFPDYQSYPALYDDALFFDKAHHNDAGARVFSEAMSRAWLALRSGHGRP